MHLRVGSLENCLRETTVLTLLGSATEWEEKEFGKGRKEGEQIQEVVLMGWPQFIGLIVGFSKRLGENILKQVLREKD